MADNTTTVRLCTIHGSSFELQIDKTSKSRNGRRANPLGRRANPLLRQLARKVSEVLKCHAIEVMFIAGTDVVETDDLLKGAESEVPVLTVVRQTSSLDEAKELKLRMESQGIRFEPGLSPDELMAAERRFGIIFPPELEALYTVGLPVGTYEDPFEQGDSSFPNWRDLNSSYEKMTRYVVDTLLFRVGPGSRGAVDVWWQGSEAYPSWGLMPGSSKACYQVAKAALREAPRVVPVFGMCITASSDKAGNPVLNMYRHPGYPVLGMHRHPHRVGTDLADYLSNRFGFDPIRNTGLEPHERCSATTIPFWGEIDH